MNGRPWRTRRLIEQELELAERGKRRVRQASKGFYAARIRDLKAELAAKEESDG